MRPHTNKKFLISQLDEEAVDRVGENLCQMHIWKRINIHIIQRTKKQIFKKTNDSIKIDYWSIQSFQRRNKNGYEISQKVLNILSNEGNAYQNNFVISSYHIPNAKYINKRTNKQCWREWVKNETLIQCEKFSRS